MKKIGIIILTIIIAVSMIGFTGLDEHHSTYAAPQIVNISDLNFGDPVVPGTVIHYEQNSANIEVHYECSSINYMRVCSDAGDNPRITVLPNPDSDTGSWRVTDKGHASNTNISNNHTRITLGSTSGSNIISKQPSPSVIFKGKPAIFEIPDSAARSFNWYRLNNSSFAFDPRDLESPGSERERIWKKNTDGSITATLEGGAGAGISSGDFSLDSTSTIEFSTLTSGFADTSKITLRLDKYVKNKNGDYINALANEILITTITDGTQKKKITLPKGKYQTSLEFYAGDDNTQNAVATIYPLKITRYIKVGTGNVLSIPASDTTNYNASNQFVCQVDDWQFTNPVSFRHPQDVTRIQTPKNTISLKKKKSFTVPVKAYAEGISKPDLVWQSSNPKIATVNQNGKVTAKKTGKVTITATAENGKKIKVTVRVVKKNIKVKKITVSGHKKTIKKGKVAYLKVKTNPINATANKVTFKSSKKKVLTVDKYGKITAKKKGTAKVTVKTGGKKKVITIKVK